MANDGSIGGGLMQALKLRMHYQQSRQKVLAENVANADSPGFRPVDLKPPSFDRERGVALARTSAGQARDTNSPSGTSPVRRRKISPAAEPLLCSSSASTCPSTAGSPIEREPADMVR